jgi:hypothetical protein
MRCARVGRWPSRNREIAVASRSISIERCCPQTLDKGVARKGSNQDVTLSLEHDFFSGDRFPAFGIHALRSKLDSPGQLVMRVSAPIASRSVSPARRESARRPAPQYLEDELRDVLNYRSLFVRNQTLRGHCRDLLQHHQTRPVQKPIAAIILTGGTFHPSWGAMANLGV